MERKLAVAEHEAAEHRATIREKVDGGGGSRGNLTEVDGTVTLYGD